MNLRKNVNISMLTAIAIILNIIESVLPILNGQIPGIKLGLANIIIVTVLYIYNFKDAILVSFIKIFVVGILRTGIFSPPFIFSIMGSLFSLIAMSIFKKTNLSIIGVSVIGSIFHIIGQFIIAIIILRNTNILYYMPIILIISVFTGIIIGYISKELIKFYTENIS